MSTVLVISDLHAPFNHRDAIDFLRDTHKKWKCDRVVCVGDEADFHRISRHKPEPGSDGPEQELEKTIKVLEQVYKLFPTVNVCLSNHVQRPEKIAKEVGIPASFLVNTRTLLRAPKWWSWAESYIIDGVHYFHGDGYSGPQGALNAALGKRMSVAMGHLHTFGGVTYHYNGISRIFGLNTGCLIDIDSLAMRYGKILKNKPTIGCGVVIEGKEAYFIPMK